MISRALLQLVASRSCERAVRQEPPYLTNSKVICAIKLGVITLRPLRAFACEIYCIEGQIDAQFVMQLSLHGKKKIKPCINVNVVDGEPARRAREQDKSELVYHRRNVIVTLHPPYGAWNSVRLVLLASFKVECFSYAIGESFRARNPNAFIGAKQITLQWLPLIVQFQCHSTC